MSTLIPHLSRRDHTRGDLAAPAQLVEFGDYECPFCGRAYPIVKALQDRLGDQMCFGFRHFPIASAHPHALLAADAAEAAGAQGQFWQMHDLLFEHQDVLDVASIEQYALLLNLDLEAFLGDLQAHRYQTKIRSDMHSGAISGVNRTPTFFINGRRHDAPFDFDTLYAAIAASSGFGVYA